MSVRVDVATHEDSKRLASELGTTVAETVALAVRRLRRDCIVASLVSCVLWLVIVAYRDKDLRFIRALLADGLLDADTLARRVGELPIDEDHRRRLLQWLAERSSD